MFFIVFKINKKMYFLRYYNMYYYKSKLIIIKVQDLFGK